MSWPNSLLKDLHITKIALVPEGADAEAYIKLFKSKGGNTMTIEEIIKELKPEQAKVVEKVLGDKKKLEEDKLALEEKLKENKPEKKEPDDILKNVDPEIQAIVKTAKLQAHAAEEAVKKMQDTMLQQEAITKSAEYKTLGFENEEFINFYKSANKLPEAVKNSLFDVLAKASKALETSELFKAKGSDSMNNIGTADKAWEIIDKEASALVTSEGITKSKAINKVLTEKPELYNEYLKAQEI